MGDLSLRVFILAGEASGDALGAALVKELRVLAPDIQIAGVAGPLMQAEGVESLYSMDELSVMGIAEVLPRYFHLLRRLRQTATACSKFRPHALITIDSPDFSLRLAKLAKRLVPELHAIHYVAPSVWAWRPGRAAHMAQVIDQVLALLPFEPPYMERAGMRCDFVGHPVVAEPVASDAEVAEFRAAQDIGEAPLCLVLPGSRKSEIARLGPVFGETIAKIHAHRSDVKFLLPMAHGVVDMVRDQISDWAVKPILLDPSTQSLATALQQKRAAFRAADVAMAASGTVSLELAAADTPMVIAYDQSWLTAQIMRRMVRIDTVTLVNLVSETRSVPEFLLENCQPDAIAGAVLDTLANPAEQRAAAALTMERLGRGGQSPGARAAHAVLEGIAEGYLRS